MKICLISFDYWNFDKHIVDELKNREGIEVNHINLCTGFTYSYTGPFHRIKNFYLKTFFKHNAKKIARHNFKQQLTLQTLEKIGRQDIILVIRPDLLETGTHKVIKKYTEKYYAYLYDSTKRFCIRHLHTDIFDKIYSFDQEDVNKHNYIHLDNYIYLPKKEIKPIDSFAYNAFIVLSSDERMGTLRKITARLNQLRLKIKFLVPTKKPNLLDRNIKYCKKEIRLDELNHYLDNSQVFVDLVRHGHNGLSFRVFEALAYQKKLITTNTSIRNYDFYNPENIFIADTKNIEIEKFFFETPYIPLPEEIYNKYTISSWVDTVFF